MVKLSAVIITYNEEQNIERCLQALQGVADEIVVLDSLSTDHTREICKKYAVRFFTHPFKGYIEQKNKALTYAKYPYVLAIDADEVLSDALRDSILQVKKNWQADGYTMNRLTNYCGKWIRHCGWYPDRKLRLFDARKGHWDGINPHDVFVMNSDCVIRHIEGDLLHYSYYSVEQHYEKLERYSSIAAKAKFENHEKATYFKIWGSAFIKFLSCFFIRKGYLEGKAGWQICKLSVKENYLKYTKLRALSQQERKHSSPA
jgi:glycosyltransferase involved in cell wall biosynthesis